jgi:putative acetyltransferase
MAITIRTTTHADETEIHRLHEAAFGSHEGRTIADLAIRLLHDPSAAPLLSLLAHTDQHAAGHVMFTRVRIHGAPEPINASILAPLAVAPEHQRRGIGTRLVNHGLNRLKHSACQFVFVLGHPAYYPRFGFEPAMPRGLLAPYPIPAQHHDAWMVNVLSADRCTPVRGTVQCAASLDKPEHWIE